MKNTDIQRMLEIYKLTPTGDLYWTLMRHAERTGDTTLVASVVALQADPKAELSWVPSASRFDWAPTWSLTAHDRALVQIGDFLDAAFAKAFEERPERVTRLLDLITSRPRLTRIGVVKWAKNNLDYGTFPYRNLIEEDYEALLACDLPQGEIAKLVAAEKTVDKNRHRRFRSRRGKKRKGKKTKRELAYEKWKAQFSIEEEWEASEMALEALVEHAPKLARFLVIYLHLEEVDRLMGAKKPIPYLGDDFLYFRVENDRLTQLFRDCSAGWRKHCEPRIVPRHLRPLRPKKSKH